MPKPREGESRQDFLNRCMGDSETVGTYSDVDQRFAVCVSIWEQERSGKTMPRTQPKNKYKRRPHSQWLTVPIEWKQIDSESYSLVGYASMWGGPPDEHGDIITQGAFRKTIKEKINQSGIPLLDSHIYDSAHTIGTVYKAIEDEHGLKIWARLSKTPSALEIRQKMIEGHLGKLSIGFDAVRERFGKDPGSGKTVRYLDEVKLYEISVVPIPALDRAQILSVKTVVPYQDLPLASREREWTGAEAEKRVRNSFGGDENLNFTKYRRAFMWYDQENPDQLGSYKLQIADFIDGRLVAIPRAIFAVAGVLQGARGGVNIPTSDQAKIRNQISRYYAKMRDEFDDDNIIPPWETMSKGAGAKEGKSMFKHLDTMQLSDEDLMAFFNSIRQQFEDFPQPNNQIHLAGMGAWLVAEMMNRGIPLNENDTFTQAALMAMEDIPELSPDEEPPPMGAPIIANDSIKISDAIRRLLMLLDEADMKELDEFFKGRNKPNSAQGTNRPGEYPPMPTILGQPKQKNKEEEPPPLGAVPGSNIPHTQRGRATAIAIRMTELKQKERESHAE